MCMILNVAIFVIEVNYADDITISWNCVMFGYSVLWKSVFTRKYWHSVFEKTIGIHMSLIITKCSVLKHW